MLRKTIYGIATVIVALALMIVAFVMNQMFDDKHQYDDKDTLVNFVHWFKDSTVNTIKEMCEETSQLPSNGTNGTDRVSLHPSDVR